MFWDFLNSKSPELWKLLEYDVTLKMLQPATATLLLG